MPCSQFKSAFAVTKLQPRGPVVPMLLSPQPTTDHFPSSMSFLTSLLEFYHHKRIWVHRTHASLKLSEQRSHTHVRKMPSANPTDRSAMTKSRAIRRRGLMARLQSGKRTKSKGEEERSKGANRPQSSHLGLAIHFLDLFESIVESRMESCQRVRRLIQNADNQ